MKKYTLINTIILSAALSGNVLADLNDGLVAYYPFNGDAKDESGNGNDGTVHGNVNYAAGKIGQAANFSGSQYVSLSSDRFLDNYCHITITSWFHHQASDANYHQIISIGDTRGGLDPISFQFQKQKLHNFGFEDVFNKKAIKLNINSKNPLIENNVWNFLAVTLEELENGSKLTVIINDEIIQEITTSEKVCIRYDTSMETQIGAIHAQQNWVGFIDDVRIYNRALSESEVQQLYTAEEEENEQPPTEISSKAIYDSSTNTLSLEGILVPFIDEFTGKATDKKGIFDVQLEEKTKLVFQVIPWSINVKGT
ncbi:LamG domain-containing protein, partial [Candidatus Marithrix sp. Canyon 246]